MRLPAIRLRILAVTAALCASAPSVPWAAPAAPAAAASRPADSASVPQVGMAVDFSAVLQVEDAAAASGRLVAQAESLGGWFTRRSKASLELRLPTGRAEAFLAGLEGYGILLDRTLGTRNLEGERAELRSRLKARKDMLQDYYAMLKESGDSTVFTIQNEIVSLQTEIERTAADILELEESMAYAKVALHFRFQERTAPMTTGSSRFRWLNSLDIPSLRGRFDYGAPHR